MCIYYFVIESIFARKKDNHEKTSTISLTFLNSDRRKLVRLNSLTSDLWERKEKVGEDEDEEKWDKGFEEKESYLQDGRNFVHLIVLRTGLFF